MTSSSLPSSERTTSGASPLPRRILGGLFLFTAGVHVGIVGADPELYRPFAEGSMLPWVRSTWEEVFMAAPAVWGLLVALGELLIGVLVLWGGRLSRLGLLLAAAFHVALMLFGFGFGFWLWSLPVLVALFFLWGASVHWPHERP